MGSSILSFNITQMKEYAQKRIESRNQMDWKETLGLGESPAPVQIQVLGDDGKTVVAYAMWGWSEKELKFGKIEVQDALLKKQGVGTTIMSIVFAIAKTYDASRITGKIAGEKYLWHWYANLGFTIYDQNKLLMELNN